jgi:hypothetical protein
MKKEMELLGLAKSRIDNGFSQVGKKLSASDSAHRALMLLASRSVAVSNAMMLLCTNNHANEALPLLRSLLHLGVEARWIAERDAAARADDFFARHKDAQWGRAWDPAELGERMKALGFQTDLAERAALSCYDHHHANAQGLPWGHVFSENACKGVTGEECLRAAAAIMGHVVKALDLHWPEKFPGAEQFWEKKQ